MTVRSYKGGEIASGLYKDIKTDIVNAGGKYHRSIYVMLEDGTISNLSIKGSVVREWSEFMEANKNLIDNQWVEINSSKDQKKGSIKYSTPEFTLGKALTSKESDMANSSASELKIYLDQYFKKEEVQEAEEVELDF